MPEKRAWLLLMAYFMKRTPMQKLEIAVAALQKRGNLLGERRITAQQTFDFAIEARQAHLLAGDLDDTTVNERLQHAVDVATSSVVGIDDALAAIAAKPPAPSSSSPSQSWRTIARSHPSGCRRKSRSSIACCRSGSQHRASWPMRCRSSHGATKPRRWEFTFRPSLPKSRPQRL